MMTLQEAMAAVDARKAAVLGPIPLDNGVIWHRAGSAEQDKAIISGYDLDYEELLDLLDAMSEFFCNLACQVGLRDAFKAAIAEALQIGLIKGADSRS